MVNGDNATISSSPGINAAGIVTADVFTSNGVIHVIDKVLIPPIPEVEVPVDEDDESRIQRKPVSLFPIIPTIGITWNF